MLKKKENSEEKYLEKRKEWRDMYEEKGKELRKAEFEKIKKLKNERELRGFLNSERNKRVKLENNVNKDE